MAKYDITPVAKPRMTQADKWKKRPAVLKYRAFCDECRLRMGNLDLNFSIIMFGIPMPKSWSKKKRSEMDGTMHQSRPDLSNLLKALEDALYSKNYNGRDDGEIASINVAKVWSKTGWINIATREELDKAG